MDKQWCKYPTLLADATDTNPPTDVGKIMEKTMNCQQCSGVKANPPEFELTPLPFPITYHIGKPFISNKN